MHIRVSNGPSYYQIGSDYNTLYHQALEKEAPELAIVKNTSK